MAETSKDFKNRLLTGTGQVELLDIAHKVGETKQRIDQAVTKFFHEIDEDLNKQYVAAQKRQEKKEAQVAKSGRHHDNSLKQIEERANSAGFRFVYDKQHNRNVWMIRCSRCPTEVVHGWAANAPPNMMLKNMRRQHWRVDFGHEPMCPDCVNGGRRKAQSRPNPLPQPVIPSILEAETVIESPNIEPEQEIEMSNSAASALAANDAVAEVAVISPSPVISKKVFDLLDDVFDKKTRLYKARWNDQRVSEEVGTSEKVVAHLRKEVYGEIAEDPAIANFRMELHKFEDRLLGLMNDLDSFKKKIEQYSAGRKIAG